ncbi:MAG: acyl carrier protein [Hyphomicrobiaceae bacterium]|nr:acyl carrier protein [Hyphomicrobiaceae bacterium]
MDDVRTQIARYIEDNYFVTFGQDELGEGTDLFQAGIFDSLALVNFALFVESTFGVALDPEAVLEGRLTTLAGAVAYVEAQRQPSV